MFNKNNFGIAVSGSHGKTTTSAIISTILKENKLDPSYVIGTGNIPSLGSSGHFGKGKHFVAEADEYLADIISDPTPKFFYLSPKIAVVTNIDYDHPDIYESIVEIRDAFIKFANSIPQDGVLIACGDGDENRRFLREVNVRKVTYGSSLDNDYYLEKVSFSPDKMFFWVNSKGAILGQFSMEIFGEHNAVNALAGIVVGLELGLTIEQIKTGLSKFKGTKRRSEFVKTLSSGALLYDDYAHHPLEIKKTLSAFRKSFPKHKIICVFQPHMYSRTKRLFNDFSISFTDVDEVLISEIFPSAREKPDPNFSSLLLIEEIKKYGKNASYFATLADVVKYLTSQKLDRNTLVITMGAGDVYTIGGEIK